MNDTRGRQFLRLAYSHVSTQIIAEGIEKLGGILHECQR
jgi:2-aminoadipate transaminase